MDSFIGGILNYKWIILFYTLIFLLVYFNRKKFEIQFGIFAMLKTKAGLKLMDAIGTRHSRIVRFIGYIGIIVGFLSMAAVVALLLYGLYLVLFVPDSPATVSPVIPGVKVPGTSFFIPFWHGIIGIFIVAVVHEFGHGVVARAHKVVIKSTGPFILGPFFGAFVEPDEDSLKKRPDIVQYSIFAAGPFFNFLLALVALLLFSFVFAPAVPALFQPAGVSFEDFVPGGPAENAGLQKLQPYTVFNGQKVENVTEFLFFTSSLKPGDEIVIGSGRDAKKLVVGSSPSNSSKPYMGVIGISNRYVNDSSLFFRTFRFFLELAYFIFILSLGIGTANLLPMGPIDGGRMIFLPLKKVFGEERGKVIWSRISIIFLIIMIFLMTPIFKATLKIFFGA